MPSNACFANESSIGVPRLRRVLRALAWLYPEIGYCQGTGMVSTAGKGRGCPQGCSPGLRDQSMAVGPEAGVELGVPREGCSYQIQWFYPEEGMQSMT